jgi:hypothetical protein
VRFSVLGSQFSVRIADLKTANPEPGTSPARDADDDLAAFGELHGIRDEVQQNLTKLVGAADYDFRNAGRDLADGLAPHSGRRVLHGIRQKEVTGDAPQVGGVRVAHAATHARAAHAHLKGVPKPYPIGGF